MRPVLVGFVAADRGRWAIERIDVVAGAGLAPAARLTVVEGAAVPNAPDGATWVLRGATSDERYVTRREHDALAARQEPLGRPASTRAALIPITKSEAWWELAHDERRRILEERSHHIATGLEYLPGIARRLHHGRDLGEPFDFFTWVEREIDIRLSREADTPAGSGR
jgi:hypothetical protein